MVTCPSCGRPAASPSSNLCGDALKGRVCGLEMFVQRRLVTFTLPLGIEVRKVGYRFGDTAWEPTRVNSSSWEAKNAQELDWYLRLVRLADAIRINLDGHLPTNCGLEATTIEARLEDLLRQSVKALAEAREASAKGGA